MKTSDLALTLHRKSKQGMRDKSTFLRLNDDAIKNMQIIDCYVSGYKVSQSDMVIMALEFLADRLHKNQREYGKPCAEDDEI